MREWVGMENGMAFLTSFSVLIFGNQIKVGIVFPGESPFQKEVGKTFPY